MCCRGGSRICIRVLERHLSYHQATRQYKKAEYVLLWLTLRLLHTKLFYSMNYNFMDKGEFSYVVDGDIVIRIVRNELNFGSFLLKFLNSLSDSRHFIGDGSNGCIVIFCAKCGEMKHIILDKSPNKPAA